MKLSILILVLSQFIVVHCNIHGRLFFDMISYDNPSSKKDDGIGCDAWLSMLMQDICDVYFDICLSNADSDHINECDVAKLTTISHIYEDAKSIRFGKSIGFLLNPLNFSLWKVPEFVKVSINIKDHDGLGVSEIISHLENVVKLRILNSHVAPIDVRAITMSSKFGEFVFRMYGRCAPNYYGSGCQTFCQPSYSESDGFYGCDRETGQKHCFSGWIGEDCKQRDLCVVDNPCRGSSICFMNGTNVQCSCPDTLTGKYCNKPQNPCSNQPCHNGGICVQKSQTAWMCECPPQFTGTQCQLDINECIVKRTTNTDVAGHPCENGAICHNKFGGYTCKCVNNHWGTNCEKPPVYSIQPGNINEITKLTGEISKSKFNETLMIVTLVILFVLLILCGILFILFCRKHRQQKLEVVDNRFIESQMNDRVDSKLSVYSECKYDNIREEETEGDNPNIYEYESEKKCKSSNNLNKNDETFPKESMV